MQVHLQMNGQVDMFVLMTDQPMRGGLVTQNSDITEHDFFLSHLLFRN